MSADGSANLLLRPVREADLAALTDLVGTIADGLTTLPNDPDFLRHRIEDSLRGFDPRVRKPGGEAYLFVMEDCDKGSIVGTSGLLSRVGGFDPFYTYQLQSHRQAYAPLGIESEHHSLHLHRNHKGPTEICSLFLHPQYRSGGHGRLLSFARFCFIKAFPQRFDHQIIAEMRGFIDANGRSPFWEAVGKEFFQRDYYTADILSGLGNKDFIEALMPRYPIYVNLLPDSARLVIGKVHPHTEPALRLLLDQGFQRTDEVDIFDAGPLVRANREDLSIWHQLTAAAWQASDPSDDAVRAIVCNRNLDFRAMITRIDAPATGPVRLASAVAERLQLSSSDSLLYVPI